MTKPTETTLEASERPFPIPGIYSHVRAQVRVDPDTAYLSISLHITAKNQTGAEIRLSEPYFLPEISGIFNLSAKDAQGSLETIDIANSEGVRFRPDAVIEPDGKYSWEISFECRGAFELQGRSIAGPYKVAVQPRLGQFLVSKHEFDYEFLFPKPKPKRGWLFRTLHVIYVADRAVNCRIRNGFRETRCLMKFSLGPKQALRLFMATRYEFSSLITLILVVVGTLLVQEIGDLMYDWVKRWMQKG